MPQLHVDRPGYANFRRCQLWQTLGGLYLTVVIEDSMKNSRAVPFSVNTRLYSPYVGGCPLLRLHRLPQPPSARVWPFVNILLIIITSHHINIIAIFASCLICTCTIASKHAHLLEQSMLCHCWAFL